MINIFNYRYKTFEELFENVEKLIDKKEELKDKGIVLEVSFKKSIYKYWSLKLKIYNEKENKREVETFH